MWNKLFNKSIKKNREMEGTSALCSFTNFYHSTLERAFWRFSDFEFWRPSHQLIRCFVNKTKIVKTKDVKKSRNQKMRISQVLQRVRKQPNVKKSFGSKDAIKLIVYANLAIGLPLYSYSQYEKGSRNSFTNLCRQPVVLFFKLLGMEDSSKPVNKSE